VFEHGEFYHVRCRARATALRSAEEADRAEESRARAADAVTRATGLIEEVRRRRESGPPAAGRPGGSS
jgi:hypothetical protein